MINYFFHLWVLIKKEFLTILRDPKSRIIILAPPLIQLALFANILTMETKNINITIIDYSKTLESREFINKIAASSWFNNVSLSQNRNQALQNLKEEKIQAVLTIHNYFAVQLKKEQISQIELFVDGRTPSVAAGIVDYINQIANTYNQKFSIPNASININVRNWFNPNATYQWYLVISLIVILVLVISLMLTSLSVAREREIGTFEQLIVSPYTAFEILIGKIIPPLIIALVLQVVMTWVAVFCFDIPFVGSIGLFFFSSFIAMLSLVGIGLFISSVCRNQQQAILGAFAFIMPAVLLSGFVSPVADMPILLQYLTYANPLRFFINIGNGVFLKNMQLNDIYIDLLILTAIALFSLALAARTFKRNLE